MNAYPTQRQEEAMADVLSHDGDSLAMRAVRLGATRSGVLQVLYGVEKKGLARRDYDGRWSLTPAGKRWLAK